MTNRILEQDVELGRWYDLTDAAGERLYDIVQANLTVIKSPLSSPVTLVINTDYTLDLKMGRVFIKSAPVNIAALDILGFTYTTATTEKPVEEVRGVTVSNKVVALKFISENAAAGDKQREYQFHQVSISGDGDFSLIGDELTGMQFTGAAEKNLLADPNSPTLTIRDHADS